MPTVESIDATSLINASRTNSSCESDTITRLVAQGLALPCWQDAQARPSRQDALNNFKLTISERSKAKYSVQHVYRSKCVKL